MNFWNSFWDLIWWFLWAFVFIAYLFALFAIIGDLFRDHKLNGWWKALWIIFLIFVPFLTALVYLIARGNGMAERSQKEAKQYQAATDAVHPPDGRRRVEPVRRDREGEGPARRRAPSRRPSTTSSRRRRSRTRADRLARHRNGVGCRGIRPRLHVTPPAFAATGAVCMAPVFRRKTMIQLKISTPATSSTAVRL